MRQDGKHIYGDLVRVDGLTKYWVQVDLSPREMDVDFDNILKIAQKSSGLFADLTDDVSACLRFQTSEDASRFVDHYYRHEAA